MQIICTPRKPDASAFLLHRVQEGCMATYGMDASQHRRMVGARLRLVIEALDLTQADVARQFRVSPPKLGNWIRGDNYPNEFFVLNFCDRYSVSTDFLYRGLVAASIPAPLADDLWAGEPALRQGQEA